MGVRRSPFWRTAGAVVSLGLMVAVVVRAAGAVPVGEVAPLPLVASVGLAAVAWLALARGWGALTSSHPPGPAVSLWVRSQVLRYLPGAVWAPALRARALPGSLAARAEVLTTEAALLATVATAVGGVTLAASGADLRFALAAAALLVPALAGRRARRRDRLGPGARPILAASAWYGLAWVAHGGAAVLAQAAVTTVDDPLRVGGAACLAWVAGFAAVLLPSGVGAREVAYVALLGGVVPGGLAAGGAVASRLTLSVAELVILAAVTVPRRRARESSATP